MAARAPPDRQRGVTVPELIIALVLVVILIAVAVPRLLAVQRDARIASVNSMASVLRIAADVAHLAWATQSSSMGTVAIALPDGRVAHLWRAYPDAGDCCSPTGIEALVDTHGFTVARPDAATTRFEVTLAPTPARCAVTYVEAPEAGRRYRIATDTTGC